MAFLYLAASITLICGPLLGMQKHRPSDIATADTSELQQKPRRRKQGSPLASPVTSLKNQISTLKNDVATIEEVGKIRPVDVCALRDRYTGLVGIYAEILEQFTSQSSQPWKLTVGEGRTSRGLRAENFRLGKLNTQISALENNLLLDNFAEEIEESVVLLRTTQEGTEQWSRAQHVANHVLDKAIEAGLRKEMIARINEIDKQVQARNIA
jgi:hypothetical protein